MATTSMQAHTAELNGITLGWREYGAATSTTLVVLCHGWPDIGYSWRHQARALATAGYHVAVPDMRGYGASKGLVHDVAKYSLECVTGDLVALLDHLGHETAVFIGHDWGGLTVWAMALHHASRVTAVASVCAPLVPYFPVNPMEHMRKRPGRFAYQVHFQQQCAPESELETDVRGSITLIHRTTHSKDALPPTVSADEASMDRMCRTVLQRGHFLPHIPGYPQAGAAQPCAACSKGSPPSHCTRPAPSSHPPHVWAALRSVALSPADLEVYVRAFTGSGFGGGINYYRNIERNWRWHECTAGQVITVPALMVTAGRDAVLPARMTEGMEAFASNLERAHVEECGHWVMLEQPEWLSRTLVEWVRKALGGDGKPSRSTLQLRSRL